MAHLWLCKSPSISLKLMDFQWNVSRVPLVGKSWATRWFSQNVGSLQVPWVSISSYRCSFPNCEIGSNLLLLYSTQSFMPLAPIRVNWALGTFAGKAFAHLFISQVQNLQKYQRITRCCGSSTHYFLLTGCPPSKHLEMSTKKSVEISGSLFFDAKIQTKKKWWETDFCSPRESHEVHKSPENRFATLKPTCLWGKMLIMYDHVVLSSFGSLRKSARYLRQCASQDKLGLVPQFRHCDNSYSELEGLPSSQFWIAPNVYSKWLRELNAVKPRLNEFT